jgi:uncharacterized protein
MRTRNVALVGVVGLVASLGGCVSLKRTPEARYFFLRSLVEPPAVPVAAASAGAVGVLPVRLPGPLERPQIVTELGPHELRVDEFARWAEPLSSAVSRTLAENLANLLPERHVLRYPWPAGARTLCRVSVELRVLAAQGDGTVRLEGRWGLLEDETERPLVLRPVSLRRGPLPGGPKGIEPGAAAEAMSELLADLSRAIAEGVRALPAENAEK